MSANSESLSSGLPHADDDLSERHPTASALGALFIVAAPSGAGKTSLVRALAADDPAVRLSVSYTTRPPRPGEHDGEHYHFVTRERFQAMVAADAFLEWAEVHGNCYGTGREWVETQLAAGCDVILEIDWQGAQQVRGRFAGTVGIFVLPPSLAVLEARLRGRGTDSEAVIARRLANAREELRHVDEFDYVIVNDRFDAALADLKAIVRAQRCARRRQRVRFLTLFREIEECTWPASPQKIASNRFPTASK